MYSCAFILLLLFRFIYLLYLIQIQLNKIRVFIIIQTAFIATKELLIISLTIIIAHNDKYLLTILHPNPFENFKNTLYFQT